MGNFSSIFVVIFFKIICFFKFFQDNHLSVKQIGTVFDLLLLIKTEYIEINISVLDSNFDTYFLLIYSSSFKFLRKKISARG